MDELMLKIKGALFSIEAENKSWEEQLADIRCLIHQHVEERKRISYIRGVNDSIKSSKKLLKNK